MNYKFHITGGTVPVNYRSTMIQLIASNLAGGYTQAKRYAKINFNDWSNITEVSRTLPKANPIGGNMQSGYISNKKLN